MAMTGCKDCGGTVSTNARTCPHCGLKLKPLITGPRILIFFVAVILTLMAFSSHLAKKEEARRQAETERVLRNLQNAIDRSDESIQDSVVRDALKQYDIAVRQGDPMQICVQAGFVTAAYLQAHDEENYRKFKEYQRVRCKIAGLQ